MSDPVTELDQRYSEPEAQPTTWLEARRALADAELSWVSTVRPDGRPHVTPLGTIWSNGALHFCTGPRERKARNLATNPYVVLTTGNNTMRGGLDVVVEGEAVRVTDDAVLRSLAEAWESKYGEDWHFDVSDGAFHHGDGEGEAWVFAVRPSTAFGFGKGPYTQTRWRFGS